MPDKTPMLNSPDFIEPNFHVFRGARLIVKLLNLYVATLQNQSAIKKIWHQKGNSEKIMNLIHLQSLQ